MRMRIHQKTQFNNESTVSSKHNCYILRESMMLCSIAIGYHILMIRMGRQDGAQQSLKLNVIELTATGNPAFTGAIEL
ncbi:MAG: hypothetical protein AB8B97_21740 [Granulosicoccus sp.]